MLTFNQYLIAESKIIQNKHSTHLEDLIIDGGKKSTIEVLKSMQSVYDKFSSKSKSKDIGVSIKFDGAPAVFFGYHPVTNKFFVGTKAIFNKTPKINYTNEDIDANHKGDLAVKLKISLEYLKKVCPQNGIIYQGDLMFTKGDLKTLNVNGESFVSCHPNTIVYAVPESSKLARTWASADIGIVMHTRYTGTDIATMQASFGVSVEEFTKNNKVWLEDAFYKSYDGILSFSPAEDKAFKTILTKANNLASKISSSTYKSVSGDINQILNTYNNTFIRNATTIDNKQKAEGLSKYISDKFQKEIDKRKTDKAKQTQIDKRDALLNALPSIKELTNIYTLQGYIVELKNQTMSKLNHVSSLQTFVITAKGEVKVTGHEGYVGLTDSDIPTGVKLVDRVEFSFNNFSDDIRKGWLK